MGSLRVSTLKWLLALLVFVPTKFAQSEDTLNAGRTLDYHVMKGAAPGYIEDRACEVCHYELFQSYREVGMAQSFYRPGSQPFIEDFENTKFHHIPSDRYYELTREGDRLTFKRWLVGDDGKPIHEYEREVDWIMGSGNHSRTYLYQTEFGEIYEFPIQWYSQSKEWGMAPGFDREDHHGIGRRVRRECMFCHNAYPEVPVGSDNHWGPHRFPEDLPEGIGCQRCHGPGAAHVEAALSKDLDEETIRSTIVNPAKLEPALRDDVCNQCHLQPTVSLFGVRRFERNDFSYRPGNPLQDYVVQMDVDEEGRDRSGRFEINHHAYRLYQSPCYLESSRELSCIRCHDPHRKLPETDREAHYRDICLDCHEPHKEGDMPEISSNVSIDDCVSCHMPKRRPQDVVHTLMTDHRIGVYSDLESLTEFRREDEPVLTGIDFYSDRFTLPGLIGEIYKAVAVLRAGGNREAVSHLQTVLRRHRTRDETPYLDLAEGLIHQGDYANADLQVRRALSLVPEDPLAIEWKAVSEHAAGNMRSALEWVNRSIELDPSRPEARYNRGLFLFQNDRFDESASSLKTSIELRPNFVPAHFYLGMAFFKLGQMDQAVDSFKETLRIEPRYVRAALDLAKILIEEGRPDEADRYLRRAVRDSEDAEITQELVSLLNSIRKE
ncbi:MAG: tetratricopeptide repeat protein [Candidatus Omnitrophica bacterium]|nr:tetratricopeptide repeat protein [Candidatus Omnitrophota bacterium]